MAKRKEEPARPYYDTRNEHEAARKAFEEAAMQLYTIADGMARHMPDADPAKRFLVEAVAKYRAAAYGE